MKSLTMIQKLASAGLGILLLASPAVASADMVADIQAQIQSILLKLEQLRAGTASHAFTASPTSGAAPLRVVFGRRAAADAGRFAVDFGDGTGFAQMNCTPLVGSTDSECRVTHAYTMPGMYFAKLIGKGADNSSQWQETGREVTFAVFNTGKAGASATIDQRSLTTTSANPTITGTVWNADIGLRILKGRVAVPSPIDTVSQNYVWQSPNVSSVAGGRWSAQVAGAKLENGIYTVVVSDVKTGLVLTTGVLVVDTSR